MSLKRFVKTMITDPNSPEGLKIRAEKMEEDAEKMDGRDRESFLLYARVLRELASKNWPPWKNKQFIKENLRP